jgi:hypothetical protein
MHICSPQGWIQPRASRVDPASRYCSGSPPLRGQDSDGTGADQLLQSLGHRGLLNPPERHQLGLGLALLTSWSIT